MRIAEWGSNPQRPQREYPWPIACLQSTAGSSRLPLQKPAHSRLPAPAFRGEMCSNYCSQTLLAGNTAQSRPINNLFSPSYLQTPVLRDESTVWGDQCTSPWMHTWYVHIASWISITSLALRLIPSDFFVTRVLTFAAMEIRYFGRGNV